jgi:hypothetical protein
MKKSLNLLLGFVLLIGLLLCGYFIIRQLWISLTSLEPEMAAPILTFGGTVIAAVIAIVIGRSYDRKLEIESKQREKKIEIYESFLEVWFNKLMNESKNVKKNEIIDEEFLAYIGTFASKLILWGSENVINSYNSFRYTSLNTELHSNKTILQKFEELLLEIRKEIGHTNKKLEDNDLLRLFINDLPK